MSTVGRIKDLDVLRGIAIIFVLIQHIPFNLIYWNPPELMKFYNFFNGGGAVDLFFVLSGFLITKLYVSDFQNSDKTQGINNALIFWGKRASRVFPAAWFWLLFSIFGALVLNPTHAFGSVKATIEGAIASLFQVANLRFMSCFDHYECGINIVQWTLSLEQQFYFIFPFLVYFSKNKLPLLLGSVLVTQLFSESLAAPFGLRFSGFIVGMLIGIFSNTAYYSLLMPLFHNRFSSIRVVLFALAILLLGTSMGNGLQLGSHNTKYAVTILLSGILVLTASYGKFLLLPPSRFQLLLTFVGERSYSYYLCHMSCFALTRTLLQPYYTQNEFHSFDLIIFVIVAVFLCAVLGELSYKILEIKVNNSAKLYIDSFQKKLKSLTYAPPTEKMDFSILPKGQKETVALADNK
ncbi:acyltransferase family protein [Legionella shakespearei]|uniref:O-antigen acetylase n=1 Tax=Legionella shakespearei DSM 23087 TaxID=1122169 RepID=A0A0W0YLA4_9GAMM|nr:acyltransferase [Legionella shakespearei]KTD57708.1 O-antigen acetylase [Legionella shakespearei DSM 23087]